MTTNEQGGAAANDHYTVYPVEDCIHEPQFSGDQATYGIVGWEVWKNAEMVAGVRSGDEVFDFGADEEDEARKFAARMNAAAAGKGTCAR